MISNPMSTATVSAGDVTELIRGREQGLLARLAPLVRRQSVTLDLSPVRRIDAAGIGALLSLHANARAGGYRFSVVNPTRRVAEMLRLVGLEGVLLSHIMVEKSPSGPRFQCVAA
jgi:anti-anti-sigma factor